MSASRVPTGESPALEASGIVAGGSASAEAEQATRDGADNPATSVADGKAPVSYKVAPIIAVLVVSAFVMILNETLLSVALPVLMTEIDRKSTRLNSSHVAISYAVFCLKKKRPQTKL